MAITIISGCITLAKAIHDFKDKMLADDAACSDFFYRIQALQLPLQELGKQNSFPGTKTGSIAQINDTLKDILSILNTRVKNNESFYGYLQNLFGSRSGKFAKCLRDSNCKLDRCVELVQLCIAVDMNAAILDLKANSQQSCSAAEREFMYEKDPKPTLENFDRLSIIGKGTFGVTHRTINTLDRGKYAVKEIEVSDAVALGLKKEDLKKEAVTLQQLNHPHIVRYFTSYYSRNETIFNVVMELIEGGSLADKIGDESVSWVTIGQWLSQMASALQYLHKMSIQHRDIKPENIMLTGDGRRIKLIDLGTASVMKTVATKMSRVGTSTYFSYEKANDIPYDGRDDVWAAGCVFAELLTKSRLSDRGGAIHLLTNDVVNDRRLRLIFDCVVFDAGLGAVVCSMLEVEQEKRCTSEELVTLMSDDSSTFESALLNVIATVLKSEVLDDAGINSLNWKDAGFEEINEVPDTLTDSLSLHWTQIFIWPTVHSISSISCCSDGSRVAMGGMHLKIHIFNPNNRRSPPRVFANDNSLLLRFSPDGRFIVSQNIYRVPTKDFSPCYRYSLVLYNAVSGDAIWESSTNTLIHQIIFTPDGTKIILALGLSDYVILNASTGAELSSHGESADKGICISSDGKTLVVAGKDKILVIDVMTKVHLSMYCEELSCLCMSSDGLRVFVGTADEKIHVFDTKTGVRIKGIEPPSGHKGEIDSLSMNSDDTLLVSGSTDGTIKVWNAVNYQLIQTLKGWGGMIFGPNNFIITGAVNMTMRMWGKG